jgi:hypothetical protein
LLHARGGKMLKEDFRCSFCTVVTRIRKAFEKVRVDDSRDYLVSTDDGTASYELKIDNNRIVFVSSVM